MTKKTVKNALLIGKRKSSLLPHMPGKTLSELPDGQDPLQHELPHDRESHSEVDNGIIVGMSLISSPPKRRKKKKKKKKSISISLRNLTVFGNVKQITLKREVHCETGS